MKKILLSALVSALLSSCYSDKGNYDYSFETMNEITGVVFTPAATEQTEGLVIELQRPIGEDAVTERIEAVPEQTLGKDDSLVEYTWFVSSTDDDGTSVKDTLNTKGYIEVTLEPGKDSDYTILLEMKDLSTTLSRFVSFKVLTRPIFKNSLFVLHGRNGDRRLGNIEFLNTETKLRVDAYGEVHQDGGGNPFNTGEGLAYAAYFNFNYQTNEGGKSENLCVFKSDGNALIYSPFGLSPAEYASGNYVFPVSASSAYRVSRVGYAGGASTALDYKYIIATDGRILLGSSPLAFFVPGEAVKDNPLNIANYRATAATMSEQDFIFWDDTGKRFLHVAKAGNNYFEREETTTRWYSSMGAPVLDANINFNALPDNLQPDNKTAIYGYTQFLSNYESSHSFFIMKDENNNHSLYDLAPVAADEGDAEAGAYTITAKSLSTFDAGMNVSTLIYSTWFSEKYLFYGKGNTIYRYNTANGDVSAIYAAPDGYTVTCLKFALEDSGNSSNSLGRRLFAGFSDGSAGAVADIQLATSTDLEGEVGFFEGFDPVKDLQFAYDYYETLSSAN